MLYILVVIGGGYIRFVLVDIGNEYLESYCIKISH